MIQKKRLICLSLLILFTTLFYGCDKVNKLEVKLGMKNNDFEYIKQGKIKKIIIQNTRDPGFRFIVTDQKAISELYDILSTAKPVQTKSTLEPDYTFEMQETPDKIYKFNYIAGLDKKDSGNLYSDDKTYVVSKRIDTDIIKSFWTIRAPKDFKKIYYSMILDQVKSYSKEDGKGKSIGIDLYDDLDSLRFILSTDLEEFKNNLKSEGINAELMTVPTEKQTPKEYDTVMSVKTVGYKTFLYKAEVTFSNKKDKTEKKYYIKLSDEYKEGKWTTKVDEKKPSDW